MEDDIFEIALLTGFEKMIVEGLFNSVQKLERFTILEVSLQSVSEVAEVVVATASMGVKV